MYLETKLILKEITIEKPEAQGKECEHYFLNFDQL
jgi:hypothetical protein